MDSRHPRPQSNGGGGSPPLCSRCRDKKAAKLMSQACGRFCQRLDRADRLIDTSHVTESRDDVLRVNAHVNVPQPLPVHPGHYLLTWPCQVEHAGPRRRRSGEHLPTDMGCHSNACSSLIIPYSSLEAFRSLILTALGGGRSRTPGAPPSVNSIPARSNAR